MVHGDDFTFLGVDVALDYCVNIMSDEYEIALRGRLGPEKKDLKSITILNRCVEWKTDGIYYEADPRHSEIIISQLELTGSKGAATPGQKMAEHWQKMPENNADNVSRLQ